MSACEAWVRGHLGTVVGDVEHEEGGAIFMLAWVEFADGFPTLLHPDQWWDSGGDGDEPPASRLLTPGEADLVEEAFWQHEEPDVRPGLVYFSYDTGYDYL